MKLFSTAAIFLAFALTPFVAQSADKAADQAADKAPTVQQQKMSSCNAQAKDKDMKGDDRKKFMSECLKAAPSKQAAQQQKMKDCNKEAGDKKMKGDDRKAFMSGCLKG
jgi:hypothetical protein